MKIIFLTAALLLGALALRVAANSSADRTMLRHVVLFKFKETATPAQIKQVEEAFRALPGKIPQIQSFEWGTNVSPENLSEGFTHCFVATFRSAADRDAYLVHPDHKAFAGSLGPVLDKALVVDFWPKP